MMYLRLYVQMLCTGCQCGINTTLKQVNRWKLPVNASWKLPCRYYGDFFMGEWVKFLCE